MTETGRQQERPGAGDAGGGQTREGYREAPEFARRDGKPSKTNANGLDVVRLIERLYQAGTGEYSNLGKRLRECVDNQAYDGGLLALLFTGNEN